MIDSVFAKLAWRMPVYDMGSAAHIALLLLTAALAAGEVQLFRRAKLNKVKFLPAMGCLLAVMEVFKQLLLTTVRGGSYSWSDFPFQLCSMPMYLTLVYPFLKTRGRQVIETFLMTFGLIGGAMALLVPVSVFTDVALLTVHSALWHILLVLCGILCALERRKERAERGRRDGCFQGYRPAGRLYLCLAAAAVLFNTGLRQISEGTCNMFFLGPSRPDLFLLDDLYSRFGWTAETLFFIGLTWTAGFLVYAALSGSRRKKP